MNQLETKIVQEETMNTTANTLLTNINATLAPVLVLCGKIETACINGFATASKFFKWVPTQTIINVCNFFLTAQMLWFLADGVIVLVETAYANFVRTFGNKDYKGETVTLEQLLGKGVHEILVMLYGDKEGATANKDLQRRWHAATKVFQAASNLLMAFQMIGFSILNALNIIGSWFAQVGNALKKYGVVGHLGFGSFNPTPNFHNRVFTLLTNSMNMISNIDMVTQSIQQGRTGLEQIQKESDEFWKDWNAATGSVPPDHKPTADAQAKSKTDSTAPNAKIPAQSDIDNLRG
jgi:hypothetical protein